eukprot:1049945-Prymnesium_polylepis.1
MALDSTDSRATTVPRGHPGLAAASPSPLPPVHSRANPSPFADEERLSRAFSREETIACASA